MSNDACSKCKLRSKNNSDWTRHQQRCRDRRRILLRFKINIKSFSNENSSQRQKTDFSYDDVIKEAFVKKKNVYEEKSVYEKKRICELKYVDAWSILERFFESWWINEWCLWYFVFITE